MNQIQYSESCDKLGGIKPWEYRTIDTRSVAGIKAAEKLKSDGWQIYAAGFFSMTFMRPKADRDNS